MLGIAYARKSKKHDKARDTPRVTAWPLIAIFAGLVVLAVCEMMVPANPNGSLALKYFLPEIAGVVCFYIVGRSRSAIALLLCVFLLPTALACLIYGPAGCLDWTVETYNVITRVYGV